MIAEAAGTPGCPPCHAKHVAGILIGYAIIPFGPPGGLRWHCTGCGADYGKAALTPPAGPPEHMDTAARHAVCEAIGISRAQTNDYMVECVGILVAEHRAMKAALTPTREGRTLPTHVETNDAPARALLRRLVDARVFDRHAPAVLAEARAILETA